VGGGVFLCLERAVMDKWTDSSTFGVLGCFFFFLALLILAGWIALQIMESMSPG
jgi:hypothetical protein